MSNLSLVSYNVVVSDTCKISFRNNDNDKSCNLTYTVCNIYSNIMHWRFPKIYIAKPKGNLTSLQYSYSCCYILCWCYNKLKSGGSKLCDLNSLMDNGFIMTRLCFTAPTHHLYNIEHGIWVILYLLVKRRWHWFAHFVRILPPVSIYTKPFENVLLITRIYTYSIT